MSEKYSSVVLVSLLILILLSLGLVTAFQGESDSYTLNTKVDSTAESAAESTSFLQRVVGGIQTVGRYISDAFTGRFGILEEASAGLYYENVSDCGTLPIANSYYSLNKSVSSAGTCFTIGAENVTLDCQGYLINYSQITNGYAVTSTGHNDSTVLNCDIRQGNATGIYSYGLYFHNSMISDFQNNTIQTYGYSGAAARNHGIFLHNSGNSSMERNNITSLGHSSYGIFAYQSSNNNITYNNVSTFGVKSYGIYLGGDSLSSNNVEWNEVVSYGAQSRVIYLYGGVIDNTVTKNIVTANGSLTYGILLNFNTNGTVVDSNNINLSGSSSVGVGINFLSDRNNITNNNITASGIGSRGIYLSSYSDLNFIINNSVSSSSNALAVYHGNANIIYNNFFNSTISSVKTVLSDASFVHEFNTTKVVGTNIEGGGFIGGNFWANSLASGFSDTCADDDLDRICDSSYTLSSFNADYLPLTGADATSPTVEIYSPANESFVNGRVSVRATASDNRNVTRVVFQYSNSSVVWTNITDCEITSPIAVDTYLCYWNTDDFSDDSEGYNIKAIAYDSAGNSASHIFHYIIDRTLPIVHEMSVIYPSGQVSVRDSQNVTLIATVTDSPSVAAGINYAQANLTDLNSSGFTNMSFVSGSRLALQNSTWHLNVSISASTGNQISNLRVYDAATPASNSGGGSWIVKIDNDAPTYSDLDASAGLYNNTVATFVVSVADNFDLDNYIFSQNWNGNWVNDTSVGISGTNDYIEYERVVYTGTFSYKFYVFDDAGNMLETSEGEITVLGNAPVPSVYSVSPAEGTLNKSASTVFEYYYTNARVDNCTLMLDGIINETTASPANNTILTFSKSLADGSHSWYISCEVIESEGFESVVNAYSSESRSLDIDTTDPTISIISPTAITYTDSSIWFNASLDEDGGWCGYSLDEAANVTMTSLNTTYFYSSGEVVVGSHDVVVSCNDSANNIASATVSFVIDYPDISINLTSPLNNLEVSRGKYGGGVSTEDDLGFVPDSINLTAKVYNVDTLDGILGAECHFYEDGVLVDDAVTNTSGDCFVDYDKTTRDPEVKEILVNYTIFASESYTYIENESSANLSITSYLIGREMTNLRSNGKYYDGDEVVLELTITKTNETGTFAYDTQNISANATTSSLILYPGGQSYYPGEVVRTGVGTYTANFSANYTFGVSIRWGVFISNNSFDDYLATTVHGDEDVCVGDFGAWSVWSTCVGSSQTRSRTDSSTSVCTEVETQGCGIPPSSCFPAGTKILMEDGFEKNIEDVKLGDVVTSYDFENDRIGYAKVLELESPMREGYYEINNLVNVTDEHPFYVRKNGEEVWAAIDRIKSEKDLEGSGLDAEIIYSLEIGDELRGVDGDWIKVESINYVPGIIKTYNLKTVDKFHVFFANDLLVHNKDDGDDGCIPRTMSAWSTWSDWGECIDGEETSSRSRTDGCTTYTDTPKFRSCEETEVTCDDGEDNDHDDFIDCEDFDCRGDSACEVGDEICDDGIDNDGDGFVDCRDVDCEDYIVCEDFDCEGLEDDECQEEDEDCDVLWSCEDWGECQTDYEINNILYGLPTLTGVHSRDCTDELGCKKDRVESENCSMAVEIGAKKIKWCFEDYVEVYEIETNKLVSRIKETAVGSEGFKLDIGFTVTSFEGFCDYCYDGVKNFDEEGIDCGGEGCPLCLDRGTYFNWLIYVLICLWILLLLLLIYLIWKNREHIKDMFRDLKRLRGTRVAAPRGVHAAPSKKLFRLPKIDFRIKFGGKKHRVERPRKKLFAGWFKPARASPVRVEVKPVRRHRPFAGLRRSLSGWKKSSYHGTVAVEKELAGLEAGAVGAVRGEKRKVGAWRRRRAVARVERQRTILRQKEARRREKVRAREERLREGERARAAKVRARAEKAAKRKSRKGLFSSWFAKRKHKRVEKKIKRVAKKRERKVRRKALFSSWFAKRGYKKAQKKVEKARKRQMKKGARREKKVARREKRVERKHKRIARKQRKIIRKIEKKKARGKSYAHLQRKLNKWRKKGYGGTTHLQRGLGELK